LVLVLVLVLAQTHEQDVRSENTEVSPSSSRKRERGSSPPALPPHRLRLHIPTVPPVTAGHHVLPTSLSQSSASRGSTEAFAGLRATAELVDTLKRPGLLPSPVFAALVYRVLVEGQPASEHRPCMGDMVLRVLRSEAQEAKNPAAAGAIDFLVQALAQSSCPSPEPLHASQCELLLNSIMAVGFRVQRNPFPPFQSQPCQLCGAHLRCSSGKFQPTTVLSAVGSHGGGFPPLALIKKGMETLTGYIHEAVPVRRDPDHVQPVYLVSRGRYAVKRIRKKFELMQQAEDPLRELACLTWLKEIAELARCGRGEEGGGALRVALPLAVLEDSRYFFLVLPFFEEDLLQALALFRENHDTMEETTVAGVVEDVAAGLEWLHSLGVAHHDVSFENVMVDSQGRCVLIDFGQAVKVPVPTSRHPITLASQREWPGSYGKVAYMAPELFDTELSVDPLKADMFALGVIMFTLLAGEPPWPFCGTGPGPKRPLLRRDLLASPEYRIVLQRNGVDQLVAHCLPQRQLSAPALELLRGLLHWDPSERPTAAQVCASPWVRDPPRTG